MKPRSSGYDRFYDIDGRALVSVTTVLSILAKPALAPWYAREERKLMLKAIREAYMVPELTLRDEPDPFIEKVEEFAGKIKAGEKEKAAAAKRGKSLHTAIECALRGDTLPPMDGLDQKYFDAWWGWWKRAGFKVHHVEKVIYSLTFGYAGTLDVIAEHPAKGIVLLDWKRGKRIYPEHGLQNTAYRHAALELGMPTDMGAVCRLTTSDPEVMVVKPELYPIEDFIAALRLWEWRHRHESQA